MKSVDGGSVNEPIAAEVDRESEATETRFWLVIGGKNNWPCEESEDRNDVVEIRVHDREAVLEAGAVDGLPDGEEHL